MVEDLPATLKNNQHWYGINSHVAQTWFLNLRVSLLFVVSDQLGPIIKVPPTARGLITPQTAQSIIDDKKFERVGGDLKVEY